MPGERYGSFNWCAQWPEDTLLFSNLYEKSSLYFVVNIEIVNAFRHDGKTGKSIVLPRNDWHEYGIIDETFTNYDEDKLYAQASTSKEISLSKEVEGIDQILKALQIMRSDIAQLNKRLKKLEDNA